MIQDAKLMLNNWAYFPGEGYKQATDFRMLEEFSRNGMPIPLTPEILDHCPDFIEEEEGWYSDACVFAIDTKNNSIYRLDKEFDQITYLTHAGYLHSFQNVYHVIMGQELEIDMEAFMTEFKAPVEMNY